ncbi:aminoacyl tRNA synthase complex-interacting multifunctional protein 2-like [Dreissena polymorpha]|uniref:Aminoacyl tRNA synthase complex-interacting multifunctional protein 2 n=1 Tax=Dreissena polymorpha TaxID=45954 RepID=A0A9D4ERC1_DREPO|nr:aminoacyl tRNA synthase complex-interacting multifunctional protein 2-like [Dreissena polymorpha]KAH3782582.1 hypothetical protein DPMN_160499 [Dreissena polymorpha]
MYHVKPYYESGGKVDFPNIMYAVRHYHEPSPSNVQGHDFSSLDPVSALEARQESILARLGQLQQTLTRLKAQYAVTTTTTVTAAPPQKQAASASFSVRQTSIAALKSPLASSSGIHDMVINADPNAPPLSLFVLFEMLKQRYSVLATSYVHSSVSDVNPRLTEMVVCGSQTARGNHQVALSLVWKKVENGPELMVSPAKQSVITGEVNIARYINRLISPGFDTTDIVKATTADEWLDMADLQLINGNSKQRNATTKSLNTKLKKSDWVVGDEFSLVDAVLFSALAQSDQISSAPENVQKWMKRCTALPVFASVMTLL